MRKVEVQVSGTAHAVFLFVTSRGIISLAPQ